MLGNRAHVRPLTRDETPSHLSRHFRHLLSRLLTSSTLEDHPQQQVELCNLLIHELDRFVKHDSERSSYSIARADVLLSVLADQPIGFGQPSALEAPLTPLSDDAFFANSPNDPRLAGELRREIRSADRIDLLCAFITWNGLRIFKDDLRRALQRGAMLRVITTTYTGITEPKALDELIGLGATIKVSYDTRATRLHAKAWLFVRNSGFGTAYLGSSNVTHAALHEGLEWNVRLSQASSPDLVDRFRVTFDSYWNDDRFEVYDSERFAAAVTRERGRQPGADVDLASLAEFEIRPFPYQEQILEQLAVERDRHGHWSNLVVAATGTGKSVIAAFDYQRLRQAFGSLKLLFIAHRHEILDQTRNLFRAVLRDPAFGDRLEGGERPARRDHVFASVQSLSRVDLATIDPRYYDMVIIDEFHHAAAPTYRRLLMHFKPLVLLGMTATPERADEIDVTQWFAGFVLNALQMRSLGFCVSVEHAHFMAERFNAAGIPSAALSGDSSPTDRDDVLNRFRRGELNAVFSVDLLNEGLDIPEVDTVLLLRPTESVTVFLQQIGRGLRLSPGKQGLTILDFIGQQRREFRFGPRFEVLTHTSRAEVLRHVEEDFPRLPAGCSIWLEAKARDVVLRNIRDALKVGRAGLARELASIGDTSLAEFLRRSGRELDDVYAGASGGWTALRRSAGFPVAVGPDEERLGRAIVRMRHIEDAARVDFYLPLLKADQPPQVASRARETPDHHAAFRPLGNNKGIP